MKTLRLYPTTKSAQENMETPKTWDEDNRSVHHIQTHVNGTVTIELRPGISERLNIPRIIPYKE